MIRMMATANGIGPGGAAMAASTPATSPASRARPASTSTGRWYQRARSGMRLRAPQRGPRLVRPAGRGQRPDQVAGPVHRRGTGHRGGHLVDPAEHAMASS